LAKQLVESTVPSSFFSTHGTCGKKSWTDGFRFFGWIPGVYRIDPRVKESEILNSITDPGHILD